MIKPLTLGSRTFANNLIQGPLAGISCAPFRKLTWRYSQPAFTCTEMISCKTLIYSPKNSYQRYIQKDPTEGPVCFQLASSDPKELAMATKQVTEYGADLIDLNCGCPVKKIRSKGAGSRLLMNPARLYQLITAMKTNTHVPVSIKIRVDGKSNDTYNHEVARVIRDAGADFVVVHGRHWTEHYETPSDFSQIAFFVNELNIPVIGNGDIKCLASLKQMFATGCAGVMVARAGVGQPWLIKQLIQEYCNETYIPPSAPEVGAVFFEHTQDLSLLLGTDMLAILQARKFAKYYARHIPSKAEFCHAINHCENRLELQRLCEQHFGSTIRA